MIVDFTLSNHHSHRVSHSTISGPIDFTFGFSSFFQVAIVGMALIIVSSSSLVCWTVRFEFSISSLIISSIDIARKMWV